jgi:hypothetical protein
VFGALVSVVGLLMLGTVLGQWAARDFGPLDYRSTLRLTIPGVLFTSLGVQTVLFSFFASILALRRRT